MSLSQEQKEKAIELYGEGRSLVEVAEIMGISKSTVWYYIDKAGKARSLSEAKAIQGLNIPYDRAYPLLKDVKDGMSPYKASIKHHVDRKTAIRLIEEYGIDTLKKPADYREGDIVGSIMNRKNVETKEIKKRKHIGPPGTTHLMDGYPYKVGLRGLVFFWDNDFSEWVRSTMSKTELEQGGARLGIA